MNFPPPTLKQSRILWFSVTALAVSFLALLLGLLCWGIGWLIVELSSVLLPLAVAGVLAYLLDPVVDFLEHRKVPRTRAIPLVFVIAILLVVILLATVVPQLIVETKQLIQQVPGYAEKFRTYLSQNLANTTFGIKAKEVLDSEFGADLQSWFTKAVPLISGWLLAQLSRVASWAGLVIGLLLVPVYTFYFLMEKRGIQRSWTDYLPIHESKIKQELVFIINSINDCLIVFFRGQVLVAMCTGTLLTIGFLSIGLPYAVLLGVMAGLLGIIPYLGVALSIIPAVILAIVQFGNWWAPLIVVGIFGLVQLLEGFVISPKIIGDRVGLHPLTIIIAVMIGTTLMGGILGGVLAIPLTAALRTLMFRYVWKTRPNPMTATRAIELGR
jgi:predicted PurR-regulated permease PerM